MSTVSTARRLVSPPAAAVAFLKRSTPWVGASVTRSFGSTAFRSPANCSASSRGLIAKAIPAASPPQIAKCVSGRFGRMKATASLRSTPRRRKRLPAWVMRRKQLAVRPDRRLLEAAYAGEKGERGRVGRDRRAGAQHIVGRRRDFPLRERHALDREHVVISSDRHRSDPPPVKCCNVRHGAPPA